MEKSLYMLQVLLFSHLQKAKVCHIYNFNLYDKTCDVILLNFIMYKNIKKF